MNIKYTEVKPVSFSLSLSLYSDSDVARGLRGADQEGCGFQPGHVNDFVCARDSFRFCAEHMLRNSHRCCALQNPWLWLVFSLSLWMCLNIRNCIWPKWNSFFFDRHQVQGTLWIPSYMPLDGSEFSVHCKHHHPSIGGGRHMKSIEHSFVHSVLCVTG